MTATEPDKSRHLNPVQEQAVALLLQGRPTGEVAEAVGVARQTLSEWRNHHPAFIAEMNRRRVEVWGAALQRLQALLGRAVEVLAEDLDAEDSRLRQQAAIHVLRAMGLYGEVFRRYGEPAGPTTPEGVAEAMNRASRPHPLLVAFEHALYGSEPPAAGAK